MTPGWIERQFARERTIRAAIPAWLMGAVAGAEGRALLASVAAKPERPPLPDCAHPLGCVGPTACRATGRCEFAAEEGQP
jgi:hypothetical protein